MLKSLNKNIIYVEKWNEGDGIVLARKIKLSLIEFLTGDDMDFYETFLVNLSEDEMGLFFKKNPNFLEAYHVNADRRVLLKDRLYREILKKLYRK